MATNTSLQKWIKLHQALSRLFCLVWFVKCWPLNFFEDEFQRIVSKFRKEKEDCSFVFPSSTKREMRHFHVLFVQRRLRNVQKSVMHGDSSCFANVNLLLFWRSRCLISLICTVSTPVTSVGELPISLRVNVRLRFISFWWKPPLLSYAHYTEKLLVRTRTIWFT